MLKATVIGLVSSIALGVSVASAGHMGGGGGGGGGGPAMHSVGGGSAGRVSMMSMRSESSSGRVMDHDMGHMRMGEMHDHDRDHRHDFDRDRDRDRDHDRFRFRFFPTLAFGYNTYSDVYDPGYDCWELHRVLIHGHLRLHRIWVCN